MPRYLCSDSCQCDERTTVVVPIVNAKTHAPLTSLTFPQVLDADGRRYDNLASFLAGVAAALPNGMTVDLAADGKSVAISFFTVQGQPLAEIGVWPQATVQVTRQGGGNHCPFVGPVVWSNTGYQTLDQLLAAAAEAQPGTRWWAGTGAGCPVTVAYRPDLSAPGNLVVGSALRQTTIEIVDVAGGLPVCPVNLPVYYAADGSKHVTLQSLAQRVQTALGAGYTVVPGPDACTLVAQHSSFLAAPGRCEVYPTRTTIVPVNVNGQPACPIPFPVRLEGVASNTSLFTLDAVAQAWAATKGARWEGTAYGACHVQVSFPFAAQAPGPIATYVPAPDTAVFLTAWSKTGTARSACFDADYSSDPQNAAILLGLNKPWPAVVDGSSRTAQLRGLYFVPAPGFVPRTLTITLVGARYVALRKAANVVVAPSTVSGGYADEFDSVITATSTTTTITWSIRDLNPADLELVLAGTTTGRQVAVQSIRIA